MLLTEYILYSEFFIVSGPTVIELANNFAIQWSLK